ncbi:unnamed protein product [Schistosoma mattheei]|uniref:Uncharacterized protein n=1 Tax=Schistosoma mattheei TaxID=31246 RepID=A0A183PCZ7_9TREM|nr:unnamed protein product [Schistosoma mattheei]
MVDPKYAHFTLSCGYPSLAVWCQQLSLEIPEEDIMYKFVEHSSLKDDRLITFRNNGCNDDIENENPAERFENIKDDYDSGKSSELMITSFHLL